MGEVPNSFSRAISIVLSRTPREGGRVQNRDFLAYTLNEWSRTSIKVYMRKFSFKVI